MRSLAPLCVVGLLSFAASCAGTRTYELAPNDTRIKAFNRFNIHYEEKREGQLKASYANYTDPGPYHGFVPLGTSVMVDFSRENEILMYLEDGRTVSFGYHRTRMKMTPQEYVEQITSEQPASLDDFEGIDRQGVQEGKALIGMSKAGVMAALGYPATHRTPSPDANQWIYWTNRFGTIAVDFDDAGIVTSVTD